MDALASLFTEDAAFIQVNGRRWDGPAEIRPQVVVGGTEAGAASHPHEKRPAGQQGPHDEDNHADQLERVAGDKGEGVDGHVELHPVWIVVPVAKKNLEVDQGPDGAGRS